MIARIIYRKENKQLNNNNQGIRRLSHSLYRVVYSLFNLKICTVNKKFKFL